MAWAVLLHVDFADCKTSLSHHGRQISESESEAQVTATGESQGSEETATGLSPQGGAEKEVDDAARQQPWFVRRFRPAQLGRGRLADPRVWGAHATRVLANASSRSRTLPLSFLQSDAISATWARAA